MARTLAIAILIASHVLSCSGVRTHASESQVDSTGTQAKHRRASGLPFNRSYYGKTVAGSLYCNTECGASYETTDQHRGARIQMKDNYCGRCTSGYSARPYADEDSVSEEDCEPVLNPQRVPGGQLVYQYNRGHTVIEDSWTNHHRGPMASFACCSIYTCRAVLTVHKKSRCCAYVINGVTRKMWVKHADQTWRSKCPKLPNGIKGKHVRNGLWSHGLWSDGHYVEQCPPVIYPGGCNATGCAGSDPTAYENEGDTLLA